MFMVIFFALAGISIYVLLKPPTDFEYEQASRIEPIVEPESEATVQQSKPTLRKLGKVYN